MSRSPDPLASISLCPSLCVCPLAGHQGLQWLFLTLKKRWERQVGLCTVPGVGSRILQGVGSCGDCVLEPSMRWVVTPGGRSGLESPLSCTAHWWPFPCPWRPFSAPGISCALQGPSPGAWAPMQPSEQSGQVDMGPGPHSWHRAPVEVSERLLAEEVVSPDRLSPRN